MAHTAHVTAQGYVERLRPPFWWWLIAFGLWASVAVAVWAYLGPWWAALATGAVMAATGALILQQSLTVRVDADGFHAGRNLLEWPWLASAHPLQAAGTRSYLSSADHHDDFFAVRPYATAALVLVLDDPADRHPRWVVSSARPDRLAAAVAAHGVPVGDLDD
ncbi:MAG TPA: DUF3093 family protein [Propionibacteriaceae bacterium]|nr:DUF3093 family protein [Propionibacteriaceae bacterium]